MLQKSTSFSLSENVPSKNADTDFPRLTPLPNIAPFEIVRLIAQSLSPECTEDETLWNRFSRPLWESMLESDRAKYFRTLAEATSQCLLLLHEALAMNLPFDRTGMTLRSTAYREIVEFCGTLFEFADDGRFSCPETDVVLSNVLCRLVKLTDEGGKLSADLDFEHEAMEVFVTATHYFSRFKSEYRTEVHGVIKDFCKTELRDRANQIVAAQLLPNKSREVSYTPLFELCDALSDFDMRDELEELIVALINKEQSEWQERNMNGLYEQAIMPEPKSVEREIRSGLDLYIRKYQDEEALDFLKGISEATSSIFGEGARCLLLVRNRDSRADQAVRSFLDFAIGDEDFLKEILLLTYERHYIGRLAHIVESEGYKERLLGWLQLAKRELSGVSYPSRTEQESYEAFLEFVLS